MSTLTPNRCGRCGDPASRPEPDPPLTGRFAELLKRTPILCETCVAAVDAEDRERAAREAAQREHAEFAQRLRRSGLPSKHHVAIDSLDHPAGVVEAAARWAAHGGGLLLTGRFGAGKTWIAGAAAYGRLRTHRVIWTSAPLLFARLGSGIGKETHDWALAVLASRDALVLDDIDKARPTEYGAEQVFLAVDQRVEHEASLLVTTNLTVSGLAERWPEPYGEAIASRLTGYCQVVRVDGPDRRLATLPPRQIGAGTGACGWTTSSRLASTETPTKGAAT